MSVAERGEQLAQRHGLQPAAGPRLLALLEHLAGDPHAPTAVSEPERAVDVHLADSLSAVDLPAVRDARTIADVGSGAGFPGLVLAIALPVARVTLVESAGRKCEFLERARVVVQAENVSVVRSRVESWDEGLVGQDLVTARAVGPLALLCEYAAPLLVLGGTLVAWKGAVSEAELRAGTAAAAETGLEAAGTVRTEPYAGSVDRRLVMYAKVAETPARFPRRPGVARKRSRG